MAYFSGEFWAELIRPRKFLILLYKSFRLSAGQSVKPPIDVKWDASSWALVINTFECQLLWSGGFRKLKWLVWSFVWLTRKWKHDGSKKLCKKDKFSQSLQRCCYCCCWETLVKLSWRETITFWICAGITGLSQTSRLSECFGVCESIKTHEVHSCKRYILP